MNAREEPLTAQRVCGVHTQPEWERDRHCDPWVQSPEPNVAPAQTPHCHLAARNDSTGASTGLTSHRQRNQPKEPRATAQREGQSPKLFLLGALAQERKEKKPFYCSGSNENTDIRYLNPWYPVGGNGWGIWTVCLLEEVCSWRLAMGV